MYTNLALLIHGDSFSKMDDRCSAGAYANKNQVLSSNLVID
jgi:UDP-2,3-diacylglucosamine pyrophosphatase LpxH